MKLNVGHIEVRHLNSERSTFYGAFGELTNDQQEAIASFLMQTATKPVTQVSFKDSFGNGSHIGTEPLPSLIPTPKLTDRWVRDELVGSHPDTAAVRMLHEGTCPTCLHGTLRVNLDTGKWIAASYDPQEVDHVSFSCRFGHVHQVYHLEGGDYAADGGAVTAVMKWMEKVNAVNA